MSFRIMKRKIPKKNEKQKTKKTRDAGRKFISTKKTNKDLERLASELKQVSALDSQLEEHFDIEKYPRVKQALEEAVSARVEDIIRQRFAELGGRQKDYRYVTLAQLIELMGITRRTPYDWVKKGLPREADGTFFLPTFIKWFEKYTIEKLPAHVVEEINPLQAKKAERLEIDLRRARNELLPRVEVMAGQVARHQNLINTFSNKAEELAREMHGQPETVIAGMLGDFFDEVLKAQCQIGSELKLPEEIEVKFRELLNNLLPK
jgi:hypothetical protein